MRLRTSTRFSISHNGGAHVRAREETARGGGAPQATEPGCGAEPHVKPLCGSVRALGSRSRITAAPTCAPARKRRGVEGPRKRPSRGVGRSPTLNRYAAPYEHSVLDLA